MIPLLLALAIQPPHAAPSHLGDIRMHLFEHATGQLSPDMSPPDGEAGWNTTLHADDLVVVAEVRTTGEQYIQRPLRIVARGPHGRILGQRRFTGILTSDAGRAYLPLWLNDVTCAGDIHVTVTFGAESRSETIQLHCGE